ncbi:hypothetical protein PQX77_018073 [Marasmius sp. AFHP31]|nr:hypothetical protein PQX77_018073 [Marasmius sp. AFHP31]
MSTFQCADAVSITKGNFSVVHGNQINNYNSHDLHFHRSMVERNPVRFRPGDEWKENLYQEYERIPLGRIKLLNTICREPVVTSRRRRIMPNVRREDHPDAERVVETASIVDGREVSLPLLTIRYTGRNAKKLFKKDCMLFSRQRSPTMPQLRAFNDSDIPTIIFNEELVSANHFLTHNRHSVAAQCYLHFQTRSGVFLDEASDELRTWILSVSKGQSDLTNLLWFRPQTGVLCFGPPGPRLEYHPNRYFLGSLDRESVKHPVHRDRRLEFPPLPLDVCNDATFLDYIINNFSERLAVHTMCSATARRAGGPAHRGVYLWKEHLTNEWTDQEGFSRRVLEIPTHLWNYSPTHVPCELGLDGSDPCERITTEKGGMRFSYTESFSHPGFRFWQDGKRNSYYTHEQWLTQAGWIFRRLRVPQKGWSLFSIIRWFTLQLVADDITPSGAEDNGWNEEQGLPCYLFVRPPPRLLDSAPDIETWLRGENLYYYSHDPEGGSAITEEERISLNLPSFTSEVRASYAYWDTAAYDLMEQWQKAKGFDYLTTDYAESLGIPILEVAPQDECRFEDMTGDHCKDEAKLQGQQTVGTLKLGAGRQERSSYDNPELKLA